MKAALALVVLAACGGSLPATRYYDLAPPPPVAAQGGAVLVLEPLTTDDAYDDERIVYRTGDYRLDYYDYHRWSAAPGVMIGNYLERGLERSGHFRAVVREPTRETRVVLTGRVAAIEEIDVSKQAWEGHVVLELSLVDPVSGASVWSEQYDEREPLVEQSPEGLAEAISAAMARIVAAAAPAIADRVAAAQGSG